MVAATKALFFSSDSYGIAHTVRNTRIANALAGSVSNVSNLLVTGVPERASLPRLADGCDFLCLPSFKRLTDGRHKSLFLRVTYEHLREMRAHILREVVDSFDPRILLVDHLSTNIIPEVEPALSAIKHKNRAIKAILAFNDILNDPNVVYSKWVRTGVFDFAAEYFDEIWSYGDEQFYSWSTNYRLPKSFRRKLQYTGYLASKLDTQHKHVTFEEIRGHLHLKRGRPLITVTAGGGHDAGELYRAVVEVASRDDSFETVIVTGPQLPDKELTSLSNRALGLKNLHLVRFFDELPSLLAISDAVIAMAGVTVWEILAGGTPSLLVPRTQWESSQKVRAREVVSRGWARYVPFEELTPKKLRIEIRRLLQQTRVHCDLRFGGIEFAVNRLLELSS